MCDIIDVLSETLTLLPKSVGALLAPRKANSHGLLFCYSWDSAGRLCAIFGVQATYAGIPVDWCRTRFRPSLGPTVLSLAGAAQRGTDCASERWGSNGGAWAGLTPTPALPHNLAGKDSLGARERRLPPTGTSYLSLSQVNDTSS